ncbi:lasso RiPP family leader peptide-containing protein [Spirosoma aerophilum]
MKTKSIAIHPSPKKAYKSPTLIALGTVRKLTLKSGSAVDGFGSFA